MRPIMGQSGKTRQKRPGGFPGMKTPGVRPGAEPDIFAQFNAWQDPSIGGQQPGALQPGYGGFSSLGTMAGTKMNNFLQQYDTGGEREGIMNQLGYFNQGNPFTPQVPRGYNQDLRSDARRNVRTGGYSEPGTYQHELGNPGANAGGYAGVTAVGETGQAQYTPFDINARGGGRLRRRGGTIGSRY